MRLLPNILKAAAVKIDNDNKVHIDIGSFPVVTEVADLPDSGGTDEETPEDRAKKVMQKANREAEQLLEKARREAEAILEDARDQALAESQSIAEQAEQEGYAQGHKKAVAEGDAIKAQAQKLLNDAKKEKAALEASLEPAIVDLIIKIVRKLLGTLIELNPAVIVNLIRQGMAGSTLTGQVVIRVSPDDYEQVLQNKENLMSLTDGSTQMEILRDVSLSRMDCVIETPYGDIDCSLDQQFEALRHNLLYILQNK